MQLDPSNLLSGLYILRVGSEAGSESQERRDKYHTTRDVLTIYPNPCAERIYIHLNTSVISVCIYDRLVVLLISEQETTTIDVSDLHGGYYTIRVADKYGRITFSGFTKL